MNSRAFLRHFLILVTGAAGAQIINLAAYPVLTRLYTPSDFGLFALFVTLASLIGVVAAGRFDLIVQSCRDRELHDVFALSKRITILVAFASTAAFLIAAGFAIGGLQVHHALLLGLAIFLTGFCAASNAFLLRHEQYRQSTQSGIVRAILTVTPQILLFWLWPGAISLMVGFCIGFVAQAVMLGSAVRRHRQRRLGKKRLSAAFMRYRGQAMIDVPSTLLGAIALNVLNVFMLALYSPAEVGHYALAFRVAVLPLVLFSASLSEVFFQKASRSYRETGSFWNEVRFNLIAAGSLSLLMFLPLAFIARPLFQFAFGDEWLLAADILVYLSPMLAIRFVSASLLTAPLVIGRPQWLFAHNAGLVAAMCAGFLAGLFLELSLKSYLLLNSALMSAVYLAFAVQVVRAAWKLRSPIVTGVVPAPPAANS